MSDSMRKNFNAVDPKQLSKCLKNLKKYKGLKVVEVHSSTGEEVEITL